MEDAATKAALEHAVAEKAAEEVEAAPGQK